MIHAFSPKYSFLALIGVEDLSTGGENMECLGPEVGDADSMCPFKNR